MVGGQNYTRVNVLLCTEYCEHGGEILHLGENVGIGGGIVYNCRNFFRGASEARGAAILLIEAIPLGRGINRFAVCRSQMG